MLYASCTVSEEFFALNLANKFPHDLGVEGILLPGHGRQGEVGHGVEDHLCRASVAKFVCAFISKPLMQTIKPVRWNELSNVLSTRNLMVSALVVWTHKTAKSRQVRRSETLECVGVSVGASVGGAARRHEALGTETTKQY